MAIARPPTPIIHESLDSDSTELQDFLAFSEGAAAHQVQEQVDREAARYRAAAAALREHLAKSGDEISNMRVMREIADDHVVTLHTQRLEKFLVFLYVAEQTSPVVYRRASNFIRMFIEHGRTLHVALPERAASNRKSAIELKKWVIKCLRSEKKSLARYESLLVEKRKNWAAAQAFNQAIADYNRLRNNAPHWPEVREPITLENAVTPGWQDTIGYQQKAALLSAYTKFGLSILTHGDRSAEQRESAISLLTSYAPLIRSLCQEQFHLQSHAEGVRLRTELPLATKLLQAAANTMQDPVANVNQLNSAIASYQRKFVVEGSFYSNQQLERRKRIATAISFLGCALFVGCICIAGLLSPVSVGVGMIAGWVAYGVCHYFSMKLLKDKIPLHGDTKESLENAKHFALFSAKPRAKRSVNLQVQAEFETATSPRMTGAA